jgi:PAS domain S-box-containing protein
MTKLPDHGASVRERADALDRFTSELRVNEARRRSLLTRNDSAPVSQLERELEAALEELRVDNEELRVAEEQLRDNVAELARMAAQVEAERQRYLDLFRYASDGYVITDATGVIREVNLAAAHLFAIEARFLVGKPFVALCARPDIASVLSAVADAAAGGDVDRELTFERRVGGTCHVLVRAARIHEQGSLLWTFLEDGKQGSVPRSGLYSAFGSRREDGSEPPSLRGADVPAIDARFLAVLAHDLRGPMSAVLGWTELLQRRSLRDEEVPRALAVIERSVRVQLGLVEDLLDMARLTAQKIELNCEPLDLAVCLRRIAESTLPVAQAKSIAIDVQVPPEGVPVVADRKRVEQIFTNLLNNALKFTTKGGRIEVNASALAGEAVVEIRDNGRGIDTAILSQIFERHVQDESLRGTDGLGLGLFIVRSLVELHGGAVTAASDGLGTGATFCVRLPMRAGSVLPPPSDVRLLRSMAKALEGFRIIVVDDDRDSREVTGAVLSAHGAVTWLVEDVASALLQTEKVGAQVVVSDISLLAENGFVLAREMRNRFPLVALIALSGFATEPVREEAIAAGFQRFLTKPAEARALVEAVLDSSGQALGS